MFKYNLLISLLVFAFGNLCHGQETLDEIEKLMFSQVFDGQNGIKEFVELNNKSDTLRYWQFNEKQQLVKEFSITSGKWSAMPGGRVEKSTSNNFRLLDYHYYSDGRIKNIFEAKCIDGDTLSIIHEFTYPEKNIIEEYYEQEKAEFKFDMKSIKIMKGELIDTMMLEMKSYIGDGYIESAYTIIFNYDEANNLLNKKNFYAMSSYASHREPRIEPKKLGSESDYTYNDINRIVKLIESGYDENGEKKIQRDITFKYKKRKGKIKSIKMLLGENYTPRILEYKIRYRLNGSLKTIEVNNRTFHYITK